MASAVLSETEKRCQTQGYDQGYQCLNAHKLSQVHVPALEPLETDGHRVYLDEAAWQS